LVFSEPTRNAHEAAQALRNDVALRSDMVPRRESGPLLAENLCHPFLGGFVMNTHFKVLTAALPVAILAAPSGAARIGRSELPGADCSDSMAP
jgi:hypothetical protein